MRKSKTICITCHKETRQSKDGITGRPYDVCYKCYLENTKGHKAVKIKNK